MLATVQRVANRRDRRVWLQIDSFVGFKQLFNYIFFRSNNLMNRFITIVGATDRFVALNPNLKLSPQLIA